MTMTANATALNRSWFAEYPKGMPHTIGELEFNSIGEMFANSCHKAPNNTALISLGRNLSYQELDAASDSVAAYLQQVLGLVKGDRIAIMLPNILQFPVTVFAALKLGLVIVNVNPLYTARECEHQLNNADCKAIVVLGNFAHTVEKIYSNTQLQHVIVTNAGDMLGFKGKVINGLLKYVKKDIKDISVPGLVHWNNMFSSTAAKPDSVQVGHDDVAFLQYTGGTTGVAKGAILTHGNILANIKQGCLWKSSLCVEGKEVMVTALPLYHIFSLTVCMFCFIAMQSACLLIVNPRDTKAFIKELKNNKGTIFAGLNTLFISLMKHPDFRKLDFSTYKMAISGGMALQEAVATEWKQLTGMKTVEGYGLTETSPLVSVSPVECDGFNGSVGLPLPSTDVQIKDESGYAMPPGELGEVCIKGPQVMRGYWQLEDESNQAIDKDGWLHTGDIGYFDQKGYLYLVDRKKDMIIVSGFNVYPTEVEGVLVSHPQVEEAAVVGEKCDKAGEKVKAFIVRKDAELTQEDVIAYCRQKLTAYKIPKIVQFVDSLPKTNVGKVLRRSLREDA